MKLEVELVENGQVKGLQYYEGCGALDVVNYVELEWGVKCGYISRNYILLTPIRLWGIT